jgi:hypothetical protein
MSLIKKVFKDYSALSMTIRGNFPNLMVGQTLWWRQLVFLLIFVEVVASQWRAIEL